MTAWLDIPGQDCPHEPNARGTACQHCGIPAELVTPDELADALSAEIDAARMRAGGQIGWLDTCNACDAIGPVHPVTGYCADCQVSADPADREMRDHPPRNGCTRVGVHPCILTTGRPVPLIVP